MDAEDDECSLEGSVSSFLFIFFFFFFFTTKKGLRRYFFIHYCGDATHVFFLLHIYLRILAALPTLEHTPNILSLMKMKNKKVTHNTQHE